MQRRVRKENYQKKRSKINSVGEKHTREEIKNYNYYIIKNNTVYDDIKKGSVQLIEQIIAKCEVRIEM